MKTTIEILKEARDLIAKDGAWGQHAYEANGCFCALGAINEVARGDASAVPASDPAREALARAINVHYVYGEGAIYHFNDTLGRTQAEVVAKFDEAIAAEEAKVAGA